MTQPIISTDIDAAALANRINDIDRARTIMVATIEPGSPKPSVDIDLLAKHLPELDIRILGANHTRLLAERLGDHAAVHSGAVRIYPAGEDPTAGYLWLPTIATTPADRARRIITDLTPTPTRPSPQHTSTTSSPQQITTPAHANHLATHLLNPTRSRPMVLLSVPFGRQEPWADVAAVVAEVGELCDVVVLHTGAASRAFAARLPRGCEAFGGAGRVYPIGQQWLSDWDAAPLRFVYDPHDGAAQTRLLIRDAHRAAHQGQATTSTPIRTATPAAGTVIGIAAGRGLVQLDNGTTVTIWPETIAVGLETEQLLAAGMRVTGEHHLETGRLDISGMLVDAEQALAGYQPGTQVLTQVVDVDDDGLQVDLLPDVRVTITRAQVTTGTLPLRALVSPGEVLVARVTSRNPWGLSLDVNDLEPLQTAPAILAGGPAWLAAPVPDPSPIAPDPEPAPTEPAGDPDLTSAWEHERAQMLEELQRARAKASRAKAELREARTRLRESVQRRERLARELEELREATGRTAPDEALFIDPAQQFRFEVMLAWARRIPAADKSRWPLQTYTVGEQFLTTLDQVEGIERAKVVDVVVEVCTGLHTQLDGREVHRLRTSSAGNAPARVREDGAVAYRVALQRATAGARRLHYWKLPDDTLELSSIRHHDDIRP